MRIAHSTRGNGRTLPSLFLSASLLVLICILTACGSNVSSTGGSASSPVTPSPTAVKGYGTAHGCPSDFVVNTAPSAANVLVKPTDTKSTIPAHVGDVVEIRLPFGQSWTGPTASQGSLELQQPAGYALKTDNVCVWRFTAKTAGTTQLEFHSRALCKAGQMCPMYIAEFPFTITIK